MTDEQRLERAIEYYTLHYEEPTKGLLVGIVAAYLGDKVLYGICPACNGNGVIYTMRPDPTLQEDEQGCLDCVENGGLVQFWPEVTE